MTLLRTFVRSYFETLYADLLLAKTVENGTEEALLGARRIAEGAQRRYFAALRTIAQVRRLLTVPPALQLNVGGQQVNLMAGPRTKGAHG